MSKLELDILYALWRLGQELRQVFSYEVAAEVDKSPRMARVYLRRLEQRGYVDRPYGKRSGWVAV